MDYSRGEPNPFKDVQHFSIAVKEQTFVAIDVENFDIGAWFSMAFVISRYPSGSIVAMEEIFVDRSEQVIHNGSVADFWLKNSDAFDYNMRRGIGVSEAVAEQRVCNYIEELRRKTPHFFCISDNPSFDIAILDNILTKHGFAPLSDRGGDLYAQVLDTWSYRLSLARIFNTKSARLFYHPHVCKLLGLPELNRAIERASEETSSIVPDYCLKEQHRHQHRVSLRHTPLHDCCEISSSFFKCLDLANAIGSLIHSSFATPVYARRHTPLRIVQTTAFYQPHEEAYLQYRQQHDTSVVKMKHEQDVFFPPPPRDFL